MTNRSAHFDEIERLLREALGDYAPPAPERVWKRVEARLPKRRRPLIGWWLSGIGLAAVVLGGLAVRSANQELPAPTKPQVSAPVVGNESIPSEHAFQLEGGQKGNQPEKPFESAPQVASVFRPEEAAKEKREPTGLGNDFQAIVLADEQTATPQLANQTPINAIESNRFDPLTMLPLSETTVETTTRPLAFPPVEITHNKRNGRWSVGIHAAPVWQWQKGLSGIDQTGHIPVVEQTQNPAVGWQSGTSIAYQPTSSWRLETGLWQQIIFQNFSHAATLRLMDGVCLNPNDPGAKQYEFHYALPSEGGSTTDVTVRVQEADPTMHLATDEPFIVVMQTTHRSVDWLVPITAKRLLGKGRWHGSARGGLLLGISDHKSVGVDHFTQQHLGLAFPTGYMPSVSSHDRNRLALRFLVGAGVEYQFAPRWRLAFEPLLTGRKQQTAISVNAGLYFDF